MALDTNCVRCGNRLNGLSEMLTDSPVVPKDGEISICIYCLNVAIFSSDSALRQPNALELQALMNNPTLLTSLIMLLVAKLDLLEHVN